MPNHFTVEDLEKHQAGEITLVAAAQENKKESVSMTCLHVTGRQAKRLRKYVVSKKCLSKYGFKFSMIHEEIENGEAFIYFLLDKMKKDDETLNHYLDRFARWWQFVADREGIDCEVEAKMTFSRIIWKNKKAHAMIPGEVCRIPRDEKVCKTIKLTARDLEEVVEWLSSRVVDRGPKRIEIEESPIKREIKIPDNIVEAIVKGGVLHDLLKAIGVKDKIAANNKSRAVTTIQDMVVFVGLALSYQEADNFTGAMPVIRFENDATALVAHEKVTRKLDKKRVTYIRRYFESIGFIEVIDPTFTRGKTGWDGKTVGGEAAHWQLTPDFVEAVKMAIKSKSIDHLKSDGTISKLNEQAKNEDPSKITVFREVLSQARLPQDDFEKAIESIIPAIIAK